MCVISFHLFYPFEANIFHYIFQPIGNITNCGVGCGALLAASWRSVIGLKDVPLTIKSDSLTMIEGLTTNLRRWEDEGYMTVEMTI
jgi:hypothetical protein